MIKLILILLLPVLITSEEAKEELVSVSVLFRHGARAPSVALSNKSFESVFSNGIGELTDDGIATSVDLGKFLGDRYVNTGFLRSPMKPSELYFRSMHINRCLITASAVGSGMFSRPDRPAFVPVYSYENNETILNYRWMNCPVENDYLRKECPDAPSLGTFHHWPDYEGFVFECLGLHVNSTVFPDGKAFAKAEMLVNEILSGFHNTPEFSPVREELFASYRRVFNFIIGADEYRNEAILRVKGGHLLHQLQSNLLQSWDCRTDSAKCSKKWKERKFVAYSTQDWLVAVALESMGVRATAIGSAWPSFNSLIVLELWRVGGEPNIKLFYKKGAKSPGLVDLTPSIPSCSGKTYCPLSDFLSVFQKIAAPNSEEACNRSRQL